MIYRLPALFLSILFIGIAVRLININQPLLEYNATRQVQTAMIVRNFAFGGFHFLHPEVDDQGRGPTYLMQDFPIITAPLALICYWLKGIPEWLLRSSSLVFFIMAAIVFYKLTELYWGQRVAFFSSLIFIFSPLSILMSRTFQPDMPMIFFMLLCFYYFSRWLYSMSWRDFILATVGFMGAVLLKVTNLYMLLPISYLLFATYKKRNLSYWKLGLFFLLVFLPIIWWWGYHTARIRTLYPTPYDTFSINYVIDSMKAHLIYIPFYTEIFKHIIWTALTPLIFITFLYGLFHKRRNREDNFLALWFAGVILFFLIVPEQSKQEYYMLNLVPVASIFTTKGILIAAERIKNKRFLRMATVLLSLFTLLFVTYVTLPKYLNRPVYADIVEAGKAVDNITEKDALIIASHGYGPDFLYYCNRRGWTFLIDRKNLIEYCKNIKTEINLRTLKEMQGPIQHLERLKNNGADYFALVDVKELDKNQAFKHHIMKNYKILTRKDDTYIVFKLKNN